MKSAGSVIDENQGDGRLTALWCWIVIALIIIGAAAIRWHLVTMPLERDEGEYAYIAQQILKGVPPYESAYSMKLPGIYAIYAFFMAVFGQTITAIHLGLIIFNAATIVVIFLLARYMFGDLAGVAAGAFYAVLSVVGTTLGMTANAEHFVLLPSLIGILLIVRHSKNRSSPFVFGTALLFGLAFIIKQHGIFLALFGGLYLLCSGVSHRPVQWRKTIIEQLVFMAGAIIPYVLVCLYYRQAGVFDKFWFWTVTYSHAYSSIKTPAAGLKTLFYVITPIITTLPLVWLLALAGLAAVFVRRNHRSYAVFVAGFMIFSFLAVCPGFYFRPHYFILLCPVAAVLAGVGFGEIDKFTAKFVTGHSRNILVTFVGLAVIGISFYQHRYLLVLSPADVCRVFYQGHPFNESLEIAEYIRNNSSPNDTIAIFGSEPQIYFYSGRRAATRYIYMYSLTEQHSYADEMRKEMMADIENARPEFLIYVNIFSSWAVYSVSMEDFSTWRKSYIERSYNLVGMIDMQNDGTVYCWNEWAQGYKAESDSWITVFRRKY
jgi:hypothetical protein